MQINNVLKLGMVAMLSVTMAACSSTEEEGPATATTPAPTANTQPAANSGQPSAEELARQRALAMTTFYFEFDKDELSTDVRDALVHHANELKANPNTRIRLEGHASEEGTREYNLALGERRAQAVQRYLQVQGVAANQMEVISYGEEMPAQTGTTEQSRSRNRRVELRK
jgi:peptidoglycan-associated lipoprotein